MGWESYRTCVDPALEILEKLHDKVPQNPHLKNTIQTVQLDLRFFKMFFWALASWEEIDNSWNLGSVISNMARQFGRTAKEFKGYYERAGHGEKITYWEQMSYPLLKKIMQFKRQAKESCTVFLGGAFECKSYNNVRHSIYASETDDFIGFILENLQHLSLKYMIPPLKQQMGFIEGKLKLFRNFTYLVTHWTTKGKNLDKLFLHTRTWANHVSFLVCLYWIDKMDRSLARSMGTMLSNLMHKTMPYTPEVIGLYVDVLKTTFFSESDTNMIRQLVASYVDFLLEDVIPPVKYDIDILREGLIFLLTFVMDPPKKDSRDGKLIRTQIDAIISEVPFVICSIHFDKMKEPISIIKAKFSDFLERIDRVKAEVRQLYVLTPHPSQFYSPRTNVIGFLDFLIRSLKKTLDDEENFFTCVKHRVSTIWEELASIRRAFQNEMELQSEHEESKHIWALTINVVYYAEYVINLCSVLDIPVWYSIVCLSIVMENIKLVKIKIQEIQGYQLYNNRNLIAPMVSSDDALPPQATTSRIEEVFVGFKEDTRTIIDQLTRGLKHLTIISISGMAGQGKTTIARKIYNDLSIQCHFHKIVWCYVSKGCKMREILIKIVRDVSNVDAELILKLENQDIVERLRKSLKRQRYLIIMDDIWDVDVWRKVEGSFPDDKNGSRIMFTSRNHNLASQAKPNSISHPLRLFSDEESWKLMKEKLFSGDHCPPEFLETGKQIATYCKGLPLAVVLTATLLGRKERKLDLWNQVAQDLKSHLASEGCMHIMELSYKHLPDHLKPCFLYFGAFPRGEYIRAKKLKLLWITEGFINENEIKRSEDLAEEYLANLVCQSLVVVTEVSSIGGIKTCAVHDLLYDLCLEKALAENFFHLADERVVHQCSFNPLEYNHHRLCISTGFPPSQLRPICAGKELLTGRVHSLLWFNGGAGTPTYQSLEFSPFLNSFRVITVLDLEGIFLDSFWFPKVIMSIVHLRYLAIWASINTVSSSLANLWNLQTLILRTPRLQVPFPDTILKLGSVRHVNVEGFCLYFEDFEENDSSVYNIESLFAPIIWSDHQTKKFLSRLPSLRRLHCYMVEKFDPRNSIWFSIFGNLKQLETLRIDFVGKEFYGNPFEKFPAFNLPENLKKLTLSGFKLPWSVMSTIGKMSNLEVLKLEKEACKGRKWDLEDGLFANLRLLKLWELDIEELNVSSDPFPCLEELLVIHCDRLEEIPACIGDICTLKTIKVLWSYRASGSVRQMLKEQREVGNSSPEVVIRNLQYGTYELQYSHR